MHNFEYYRQVLDFNFSKVSVNDMLNKNTLGVKKVQGQSEAVLYIGTYMRPKTLISRSYCLLRGRIKEKSSTIFTIKCLVCCFRYQVCCIGNTALWLANTVQLFQLSSATAAVNNPP